MSAKIFRLCLVVALAGISQNVSAQGATFGPADPVAKDISRFDPRRPMEQELMANVPSGFTIAAVGDLIISRPLSQYAERLPAFKSVLDIFRRSDVTYGNLETTIFDPQSFSGSPYSYAGDWTVSSLPEVAHDLKAMNFSIVSRANNHAQDWGLEGMRETGHWLNEAGISHAGAGETHGLARSAQYFESARGRVALVSLASTFRPTSESLPAAGSTPGRPGVSGLHLSEVVHVPQSAIKPLADVSCALYGTGCEDAPLEGELFGTRYQQGEDHSHEYVMDAGELAEIYRSIRSAQQNADFVIVSIHAHECSRGCEDDAPRGPGNFLKQLAREAIDSGAHMFVTTGNHNLGPIEIYDSPARGYRPIFYGLGNFFWSDIQEYLPHDLYQGNRETLEEYWQDPDKATDVDLAAPLNVQFFAHAFTFQSVVAEVQFEKNQLSQIVLHPIELGYGAPLTESGIPRLVADKPVAEEILRQVTEQTAKFGLPELNISYGKTTAVIKP
jgi:poly-gamma-glutamate synthesis protein (capsule biosynthesis protein)